MLIQVLYNFTSFYAQEPGADEVLTEPSHASAVDRVKEVKESSISGSIPDKQDQAEVSNPAEKKRKHPVLSLTRDILRLFSEKRFLGIIVKLINPRKSRAEKIEHLTKEGVSEYFVEKITPIIVKHKDIIAKYISRYVGKRTNVEVGQSVYADILGIASEALSENASALPGLVSPLLSQRVSGADESAVSKGDFMRTAVGLLGIENLGILNNLLGVINEEDVIGSLLDKTLPEEFAGAFKDVKVDEALGAVSEFLSDEGNIGKITKLAYILQNSESIVGALSSYAFMSAAAPLLEGNNPGRIASLIEAINKPETIKPFMPKLIEKLSLPENVNISPEDMTRLVTGVLSTLGDEKVIETIPQLLSGERNLEERIMQFLRNEGNLDIFLDDKLAPLISDNKEAVVKLLHVTLMQTPGYELSESATRSLVENVSAILKDKDLTKVLLKNFYTAEEKIDLKEIVKPTLRVVKDLIKPFTDSIENLDDVGNLEPEQEKRITAALSDLDEVFRVLGKEELGIDIALEGLMLDINKLIQKKEDGTYDIGQTAKNLELICEVLDILSKGNKEFFNNLDKLVYPGPDDTYTTMTVNAAGLLASDDTASELVALIRENQDTLQRILPDSQKEGWLGCLIQTGVVSAASYAVTTVATVLSYAIPILNPPPPPEIPATSQEVDETQSQSIFSGAYDLASSALGTLGTTACTCLGFGESQETGTTIEQQPSTPEPQPPATKSQPPTAQEAQSWGNWAESWLPSWTTLFAEDNEQEPIVEVGDQPTQEAPGR